MKSLLFAAFVAAAMHLIMRVYCQQNSYSDNDFKTITNNKLERIEESMTTFIYDTIAKLQSLKEEIRYLNTETANLRNFLQDHESQLQTLKWATEDLKQNQLPRKERDLVTEMQWAIFDLKQSFRDLEEEACFRNTDCSVWTEWSRCSVECGSGTRIRSRDCIKSGKFQSMCEPLDLQEEVCKGSACKEKPLLPQFDCPASYVSFQDLCLKFSKSKSNRLSSSMLCEKEGGFMVEIDSEHKQRLVKDFIDIVAPGIMVGRENITNSETEYWNKNEIDQRTHVAIDGMRNHQQTVFRNWRGEVMTYFNWAVGEPRNDKSNGMYCVTLNVLTGEWYMKCCDLPFFYVCESAKRTGNS
jgi:hypothetical protein